VVTIAFPEMLVPPQSPRAMRIYRSKRPVEALQWAKSGQSTYRDGPSPRWPSFYDLKKLGSGISRDLYDIYDVEVP
jgi:hypothetical protein